MVISRVENVRFHAKLFIVGELACWTKKWNAGSRSKAYPSRAILEAVLRFGMLLRSLNNSGLGSHGVVGPSDDEKKKNGTL